MDKPVPVLCIYKVKKGKEAEFLTLLEKHWPTLRKHELATPERATVHKAATRHGDGTVFTELFGWASERAIGVAHETPAIMQIWEPMGALCDDMDFLHIQPVKMPY
jgi:hypothetical protein